MPKRKEKLSFRKKNVCVYSNGMTTERAIQILLGRRGSVEREMDIYEFFYKKYLSLKKRRDDISSWISYFSSHPNFFTDDSFVVDNKK